MSKEVKIQASSNSSVDGVVTAKTVDLLYADASISDMFLQFDLTQGGTDAYVPFPAFAMIDTIRVNIGAEIHNYTGQALFDYVMSMNNEQKRANIKADAGGDGGTSLAGKISVPILAPGNLCVDGLYDRPFPIFGCGADMRISVKFRPIGDWRTAGTATAFAAAPRLFYSSHIAEGGFPVQGKGVQGDSDSGQPATYAYPWIDINSQVLPLANLTGGADFTVDIKQAIPNNDILHFILRVVDDANHDTDKDYFDTDNVTKLLFRVRNQNLYEHWSDNEGDRKHNKEYGFNNKVQRGGDRRLYKLPFTELAEAEFLQDIGAPGVNLFREEPKLTIQVAATDTYYIYYTSVFRQFIVINSSGAISLTGRI
jgi:hypothetical protein